MTIKPNLTAVKRIVLLILAAFAFNLAWELAQMPLYADIGPLPTHFVMCLVASVWDALIVLALYGLYSLSGRRLVVILLAGFVVAAFIEERAIIQGRWFYNGFMPIIPFFEVGLTPLLQMLLLPILSVKIAEKFFPISKFK